MKLEVKNLKKSFDKILFENLSFKLETGDVLGILGKSGIGKTTLINILLGIEKFDSGELQYSQKPKFSVVFQENLLFEDKTVYDNLKFVSEDRAKNIELLRELELENYKYEKAKILSGGMKRRLSLARALAYDGNIFIMDEAIREVDKITKQKMIDVLLKYRADKPMIYITHEEIDLELIGANNIIKLD